MYETLLRPHDVSSVPLLLPIGDITERLKQAETKREEKRLRQIAANKRTVIKRKRDDDDDDTEETVEEPSGNKRVKIHEDETNFVVATEISSNVVGPDDMDTLGEATPSLVPSKLSVSKAFSEVRGHTSYLTFACLIPKVASETTPPQDTEADQALTG